MITALISLALSLGAFFLVFFFFGIVGAILPALLVLVVSFFLISRRLGTNIEKSMAGLQEEILKGQVDRAIARLKDLQKRYGRWQFFLSSTIDGQIGSIYYMKGQFQTAKPYLQRAFVRHWVAKAMLALIYYRERKMAKMNEVFLHTTRYVKNAGLLWSLWAYCYWRNGEMDKAIATLIKGKSYLGDKDVHLSQNLLSLQNDKRMKMKAYGEQWYQFQLEHTPAQTQMRQGRVRFKSR
jgi:tetratricopeptide (TPR) repeat protein